MLENLFRLSNGQLILIEWVPPYYYSFTLYDKAGTALSGGDIVAPADTSHYTIAEKALQQMGMDDVTIL